MSSPRTLAGVIGGAAALVALYLLRGPAAAALVAVTERVEAVGVLAPVAFVALYVTAILCLLPAGPLLLASGALFGLLRGVLYGFAAHVLAGATAFALARRVARTFVERRLQRADEVEAIDRAIRRGGLRTAFLIRLSPLLPASLINYGLGLTSVRVGHYLAASLATLPLVVLYAYYGKALGDLARLSSGATPERGPLYWALLIAGGAATLAVTLLVSRRARRILERESLNRHE